MLEPSIFSFHFYFLVAVLQGFVLSCIIIFRKPVKRPGILFGCLTFLFSLSLLHGVFEESIHAFNARFPFPMEYGFLLGPLVYFHIKSIIHPKFTWKFSDLWHLVPSFLSDFVFYILFFNYVGHHMDWAYAHVERIQLLFMLIAVVCIVHMGIYTWFVYRMIATADIKPRDLAETISGWFKTFLAGWLLILAFLGIAIPVAMWNIDLFDEHSYLIYKSLGVIKSVCIYYLGYHYLLTYSGTINRYVDRVGKVKYSPDEITAKKQRLLEALEGQQLYMDENLTIDKLARHLGWQLKDVSWLIGEVLDTNFNELLNHYRIKAFKELVLKADTRKYSILGLAQQVGFNSKASFYRAFKKECGQTPTEFLASKPSNASQIPI